jgi:hypothetical protein
MSLNKPALVRALPIGAFAYVSATFVTQALVARTIPLATIRHATLQSEPRPLFAGPVIQVEPIVQLEVPEKLRGSDGERVSISIGKMWLGHGDDFPGADYAATDQPRSWDTSQVDLPFAVTLVPSAGLEIRPDSIPPKAFANPKSLDDAPLSWNWNISAKLPGAHVLLIEGLPLKGKRLWLAPTPGRHEELPSYARLLDDGTIEVRVNASTALGLTAGQDGLLKAINGLVGFLGVVFAYPFLKWRLERMTLGRKSESREPPPDGDDQLAAG